MRKKITITLSDKATNYFYDRIYSETKADGATPVNQSECISNCLEELQDFENETGNQVLGWLDDFKKLKGKLKEFVSNPSKANKAVIKK